MKANLVSLRQGTKCFYIVLITVGKVDAGSYDLQRMLKLP